jgi:hypothetical protein
LKETEDFSIKVIGFEVVGRDDAHSSVIINNGEITLAL